MEEDTLRKAVAEVTKVSGGGAALARKLGLRRQAIYQWSRIPAGHVLTVEKLTQVPRHKQRPDLYPDPETERLERAAS